MEIAIAGLLDKQISLEVSNKRPEEADSLDELVYRTEISLTRICQMEAAGEPIDLAAKLAALADLQDPHWPTTQTLTRRHQFQNSRKGCVACNAAAKDKIKMSCPGQVCYWCKQYGHILPDCPTCPTNIQQKKADAKAARLLAARIRRLELETGRSDTTEMTTSRPT